MFSKRDCEPDIPKKCKERNVVVIKEPDCIEPLPPEYKDKEFFKLDSTDPIENERAKCLEDCHVKPILIILKECEKRVTRKLLYTAENCHPETIDLMEAMDECVKAKGFNRLA